MSTEQPARNRETIKSTRFRSQLAARNTMRFADRADRVWFGGQLRRGLDYVDGARELQETGWASLLPAIMQKLRLERRLPASDFIRDEAPRRFIGGTTGRSGTGWLVRNLGQHLPGNYSVMTEVGLFNFTQFRAAPYEYYYLSGNTAEGRRQYLDYFQDFLLRYTYDSKRAFPGGARGLRDLVPARAIELSLDQLAQQLGTSGSIDDCYKAFGDFYCWLFNFHAVVSNGSPLWISKEPAYGRFAVDLFRLIPSSKLVILVRDGRDVAVSMVRRGWHVDVRDAMDRWRFFTSQTLAGLGEIPESGCMIVCYEDLVVDYAATIQEIFEFFELPEPNTLIEQGKIGPLSGAIGRWQTALSEDDLAYFQETCATLATELGYD